MLLWSTRHIPVVPQKPCRRQLMVKVYNSAIFVLFVQTTMFNNISKMVFKYSPWFTDAYHSAELYTTQHLHVFKFSPVNKAVHSTAWLLSIGYRILSYFVHMCMCGLIPRLKIVLILVWEWDYCTRKINQYCSQYTRLAVSVDKAHEHHIGEVLHLAAYW